MAYLVRITPRAQRDLAAVYAAIHADQSDAALRWFRGLERALLSLEEKPARCPATPEDSRLRQLLYSSKSYAYRIIFCRHRHTNQPTTPTAATSVASSR
jgi:plasmid stabilization system protein ParE